MQLLTVQHKDVLNKIINDGEYHPDFNLSKVDFDSAKIAYNLVLENYNEKNNTNADGLIFAFQNFSKDEFYDFVKRFPALSGAFHFYRKDYSILELEIDDSINTSQIEFNSFISLLADENNPKETSFYEKTFGVKYSELRRDILNLMKQNKYTTFFSHTYPVTLLQAHYHEILPDQIKGVYKMCDSRGNCFKDNESAIILRQKLGL